MAAIFMVLSKYKGTLQVKMCIVNTTLLIYIQCNNRDVRSNQKFPIQFHLSTIKAAFKIFLLSMLQKNRSTVLVGLYEQNSFAEIVLRSFTLVGLNVKSLIP